VRKERKKKLWGKREGRVGKEKEREEPIHHFFSSIKSAFVGVQKTLK
jgi:hypothetical protein